MRRLAVTTALALLALAAPAAAQDAHSPNLTPRQDAAVRGAQRHDAQLRHRHRVRAHRRAPVRAGRLVPQRPADRRHQRSRRRRGSPPSTTAASPRATRRSSRRGERTYVTYTSDTVRRRHVDLLPRGCGARLRGPQGRRHRPQRHLHRRHHRPARAGDGLLRARRAGLAQPDRAPERRTTSTTRTRTSSPRTSRRSRSSTSPTSPPRARSASWRSRSRPGLGTESHDITFNEAGDRAYSAALSQGVIIDTTRSGRAGHRHELPRPGDQRLAPVRPVHAHRRDCGGSASS